VGPKCTSAEHPAARVTGQRSGLAVRSAPRPRRRRPVRLRPHQRSASGDGGYTMVDAALIMPIAILFMLLVAQFALIWHARHVADQAAGEAMEAARAYQASAAEGQSEALSYLQDVAPRLLPHPSVTVSRSPTTVQVSVTGRVLSVIPLLPATTVTGSASGPLERFVTPDDDE
jgi:hypothetical protein